MVGQSLTVEMERLQRLAEVADHRREMLAEVQQFIQDIADSGRARATATLLDGPLASPDRRDAGTRKTWAAHLAQLGNADPWTVEMDLRLTSYMAKDMGVGSAAALLRIKRDHVAMRWHLLSATKFQFDIEGLRDALCERIAQSSSGAEA